MHDCNDPDLVLRWFPIARSEEVEKRHVFHAKLLGEELAVWRDDEGRINAWENRCAHRGVRLTIGDNLGAELRCRYHGWRYLSGTGQCSVIPAHPGQTPSPAIRAKAYRCAERYNFVWVSLGSEGEIPEIATLAGDAPLTLRSIFVEAAAPVVGAALAGIAGATIRDPFTIETGDTIVTLLQPVSQGRCIIHAALTPAPSGDARLPVLRQHNERLSALRDAIERAGTGRLFDASTATTVDLYRRQVADTRLAYCVAS